MLIATVALSSLLALVFALAGAAKLGGEKRQVETADRLHVPWARYRLIAAPEIAASAGLMAGLAVAPLGVAAAIGLVVVMTSALVLRCREHDAVGFLLGDAMLVALAASAAVLRIVSA